ncbi:MAG: hypothetical protein AABW63_00530 [Nanoarchaeota archaeon]
MSRKKVVKKKVASEKAVPHKLKFSDFFSTSHFSMGLFAAVGLISVSLYISKLFTFSSFGFLLVFLIVQLGFAIDYYYERNIDERFLISFYTFSIIFLVANLIALLRL